jgi:hypothetical protein
MPPQVSWLFFKARAKYPYLIYPGRASNAENSQLTCGRRVALKMGRRLRCSSVTYRFQICAPPCALPAAHFERNDITIIYETVHYGIFMPGI